MTTLSFDIFWRDHGAERGLKNLGQHAQAAHGKIRMLGANQSIMAKLGGGFAMLGRLGAASAAALGASAVAAIGWGVKVAAGNEQAKIGFTKMLGSAKLADKMIRDLQQFAARTPFEFPGLQKMASRFVGAGFSAKSVIPILRSVGDSVASIGGGEEEIGRATTALIQMKLAGKVTMQDLNQLTQAGIDVFGLLAQETGRSKSEIVKLARAGKLTGKDLDAIFTGLANGGLKRVRGAMDAQSRSLKGMFSTMKDVIGMGLGKIIEPLIPQIKSVMGVLTGVFEKVVSFSERNRSSFKKLFGTIISILGSFGRIVLGVFSSFNEGLGTSRLTFKGLVDAFAANEPRIIGFFIKATDFALLFAKGFLGLVSGVAKGFAFLLRAASAVFMSIMAQGNLFLRAMEITWGWLPGIGPKFKIARKQMDEFTIHARDEFEKDARSAEDFARKIDNTLIPGIDHARLALADMKKLELSKHFQKEARQTAGALDKMGAWAEKNGIKIKSLGDITKMSAKDQLGFRTQISRVSKEFGDQIKVAQNLGVSRDGLNKIVKTGRKNLADELVQMGMNKRDAKLLADAYISIPGKQKTKFEQDRMDEAIRRAKDLDAKYRKIERKISTKFGQPGITDAQTQAKLLSGAYKNTHDAAGRLAAQTDRLRREQRDEAAQSLAAKQDAQALAGQYGRTLTAALSLSNGTDRNRREHRDEATQFDRTRREARDLGGQYVATMGSGGRLAAQTDRTRRELRDQGSQADRTRREARDLENQYRGTTNQSGRLAQASDRARRELQDAARAMGRAAGQARSLDRAINGINGKRVSINFSSNASALAKKLGIKLSKGGDVSFPTEHRTVSPFDPTMLARGGAIHGPGGPTEDAIPAWLSNGEYVINSRSARRYRMLLEKINNSQGEDLQDITGGAGRFARGGLVNMGVGQIPPNARSLPGKINSFVTRLSKLLENTIHDKTVARMKALVEKLLSTMTGPGGGGVGSVPAGPGWGPVYAAARRAGARWFTTYPGHDQGASRSRDITPPSWAVANAVRRLNSIWYTIYRMQIASVTRANRAWLPFHTSHRRGDWMHMHHVHVTLRPGFRRGGRADDGGLLPVGGMAFNDGKGPERILKASHTKQLDRLLRSPGGGGGGAPVIVNISFPNYVGNQYDLEKAMNRALSNMSRTGLLVKRYAR